MSSRPSPSSSTDLAEAHRLALAKLREMGMEIASELHARVKDPEADLGDVATKFAQVARAVRHTIALEAKLAEAERRLAEDAAAMAAETSAGRPQRPLLFYNMNLHRAEHRQRTAVRKLQTVNLVRRAIRDGAKATGIDRDALDRAFDERLAEDYNDYRFSDRTDPVATIQSLCRDLGLSPDWNGLSELDWGKTCREIRSGLTGAPLASFPKPHWRADPDHDREDWPIPGYVWKTGDDSAAWMGFAKAQGLTAEAVDAAALAARREGPS